MPLYKAIFRLKGGKELEASHGYVPDGFFDAIQKVTAADMVATYEDRFVLTNEMHEKLDTPGTFISYASVGEEAPPGSDQTPEFAQKMLQKLKMANHARPLKENIHYQVFYMEYIEPVPDDD